MPVSPADLFSIRLYCTQNSEEFTNRLAERLVSQLGVPAEQANVAAANCCHQIVVNGAKGAVVGGLLGALATAEEGGLGAVPGVFVGNYTGQIMTIMSSDSCEDVRSAYSKALFNTF